MVTSAFAPEGAKPAHELIGELTDKNELPFEFNLYLLKEVKGALVQTKDLKDVKKIWLDYQPNSLAWPLLSEKLMTIIENNLTGNENLEWISADINANNEKKKYYIPKFKKKMDVFDLKKTMFVEDTEIAIVPWFSFGKIKNYSIFHLPSSNNLWQITPAIYISETIKKKIQQEKLSGLDFEKVMVST
ncbi:hypothetical protein EGI32_10135 [Ferruginibacter sp. HRS2-29]|nr:hypothetical protein [Ferruginibacter sp. HRS2-29]